MLTLSKTAAQRITEIDIELAELQLRHQTRLRIAYSEWACLMVIAIAPVVIDVSLAGVVVASAGVYLGGA